MTANYSHLFPVDQFCTGFTTSSVSLPNLVHLHLDDNQLGVHKQNAGTSHTLVVPPVPISFKPSFPPPPLAWEASYPKGSVNPSAPIPGGFGFYLSGPPSFADSVLRASEVVFGYRMMLEQGWDWVKGGKLPGIFGGVGDFAYHCSGGRKDGRCKCFGLRPMWRAHAVSELYSYIPPCPTNTTRLLEVPPLSRENPDFGFSVGRGAFKLDVAIGRWVSVAIRTKLNTIGQEDGEVQMWIDGQSVINITGLVLRCDVEGRIKGMHFQTFFGGHGDDWASPKDQKAWFADVSGAIVS